MARALILPFGLTLLIAAPGPGNAQEKKEERKGEKKEDIMTHLAYGLVLWLSEEPVLNVVTEGRDLLKRALD